jgi:Flp pilus assembly pilin Flp
MKLINAFLKDESGAVTVDWVVLTAAIVGLGIAVLMSVGNGTTSLADKISSSLANASVRTLSDLDQAFGSYFINLRRPP